MEEIQSHQFNKEDDDQFYEKMEAPKFVDFTVPDLSLPDDRTWFCLRVGCDQKHEEDMDPDALYNSFVLRVMAARSPNLRLRKALSKQAPSVNMKCPLSAPAKSSKARISRFTAITSISQKMGDIKVKVGPLPKLDSTPNGKAKLSSVAAKALTTPRYKKVVPNQDHLRSVQNAKTTVAIPKNRVVAKALVFNTPKKTERMKTSLECRTPVTEICVGMKKLGLSSQRKHVLGHSSKPSRCTVRAPNKSVTASDLLKSRSYARKLKNQEVEASRDSKGQEGKSLGPRLKRKSNRNLQKCQDSVPHEGVDHDSSDMEIDGKSRDGSLEVNSTSGSSRSKEENVREEGLLVVVANLGATKATQEKSYPSSNSKEDKDLEEKDSVELQTSKGGEESNEGNGHEGNKGTTSDKEKDSEEKGVPASRTANGAGDESEVMESDDKENTLASDGNKGSTSDKEKDSEDKSVPTSRTSGGAGDESEVMENDDKENTSASDGNREQILNNDHTQRKIRQHGVSENHPKVIGSLGKTFKENSAVAATGSQGGKYKKIKPTNPKPFRLRTDERRILREANLEKRILLAPLKELTPALRLPGNSRERNGNEIQHRSRPKYMKTSKCAVVSKMATSTPQRLKKLGDGDEKSAQKVGRTIAKSQLWRQQLVRPQRAGATRQATVSQVQPIRLSVIKETSSTILRPPKEVANPPTKRGTINPNAGAGAVAAAAAGRSSSRGRRPATVPKEPNFHRIHIPKSCTMTPAKALST